MPFFKGFTQAIREAWGYVESAVDRGLTALQGVAQYVSGGGEIATEEFAGAHDFIADAKDTWAGISAIPRTYKVAEAFGVPSPFDWTRKHVMKMKIGFTDLHTGEKGIKWITVESDEAMSRQEWDAYGQSAVLGMVTSDDVWIDDVMDYEYYIRER